MYRKLIEQQLRLASLAYGAGWKRVGRVYYFDALLVWIAYVGYEAFWSFSLPSCIGRTRGVAGARTARGPRALGKRPRHSPRVYSFFETAILGET